MKALAFALALVPQGALALSCLAPDVAATYAEAVRSQDRYSVLLGRLTFDESLVPPAMNSSFTPPQPAPIEAHFSGAYLAGGDFVSGYDAPVSVIVECAGPWCGSPTDGAEYLLFARHGEGPEAAMMVGNSMKSDVVPAIEAGAWGVFVPHDLEWDIEKAPKPDGHPRYREIAELGDLLGLLRGL